MLQTTDQEPTDINNINAQDGKGKTVLHRAVSKADVEAVRKLIALGADITIQNNEYLSPLLVALEHAERYKNGTSKQSEIVSLLLARAASTPEYLNKECFRALDYSVPNGLVTITDLLLSAMTEKPTKTYSKWEDGKSVIREKLWYHDLVYYALESPRAVSILTILKKHGAQFTDKSILNRAVRTLCDTPGFNCADLSIKHILKKLNPQSITRYQQLFLDRSELINYLLENNVSPDSSDEKGTTPLHILASNGHLQHFERGYEGFIERLIRFQGNIDVQDSKGYTPLHLAADAGNITAIRFLVLHGACIDVKNKQGQTPLHLAAIKSFVNTTINLLHFGADLMHLLNYWMEQGKADEAFHVFPTVDKLIQSKLFDFDLVVAKVDGQVTDIGKKNLTEIKAIVQAVHNERLAISIFRKWSITDALISVINEVNRVTRMSQPSSLSISTLRNSGSPLQQNVAPPTSSRVCEGSPSI